MDAAVEAAWVGMVGKCSRGTSSAFADADVLPKILGATEAVKSAKFLSVRHRLTMRTGTLYIDEQRALPCVPLSSIAILSCGA